MSNLENAIGLRIDRRRFSKLLGAGFLLTVGGTAAGQRTASTVSDRLHVGVNGVVTVMTGKVDVGQGARTELTQVAAEELKVDIESIRLIMGDTALCPDDGHTGSSMTTPRTVPRVRAACAAARQVLTEMAARHWGCDTDLLEARNGSILQTVSGESVSYGELAGMGGYDAAMEKASEDEEAVTPVAEWSVMGRAARRVTGEDIVTGAQVFPSDIRRPGMHYGKVLRPPAYGARVKAVDLEPAREIEGVRVVKEGEFVGVTGPTSHLAELARERLAESARYETFDQPASADLFRHIREHAAKQGKVVQQRGALEEGFQSAEKVCSESYNFAHIQHAPMETRAAVAEWKDGKLTVWTGTSSPFPVRRTLSKELGVSEESIRVIVPDTGGHFCGKHTGEAALEAALLARFAGKPVHVQWTREEEFTWAYFRRAGVVDVKAGIDSSGRITVWEWTTLHAGNSAISVPYDIPNIVVQSKPSDTPVREGAYRAVAAPANLFARESFMDELAHVARMDPLEFRLRHISDDRLRAVLDAAATKFGWQITSSKGGKETRGMGLACGIEKGSYVATCAEVEVDRQRGEVRVLRVCEAFECGAIINPANLKLQVEGAIVMGMGGALWEEMHFDDGRVLNAGFGRYRVPRFSDLPKLEIILMDRPDLPSAGAGETPMITIAPAIANAAFAATGIRVRSMPMSTRLGLQ